MSSAIQDLQKAIFDSGQSLTQLLRQTKVIAAELNLADVEKWVDLELEGYPLGIEPPEYREYVTGGVYVHNPYNGWQYVGDKQMRRSTSQPIAEIENLSKQETLTFTPAKKIPIMDSLGGSLSSSWPQKVMVNPSQFKDILEAVRNRLLDWTTELRKRGIKGENMNFDEKEKQAAASQTFNIGNFHGVLGTVTNSQVTLYDYSSVQQLLVDRKVPKQGRRELEDIMDELKDAPPDKKPSLVARAEQWIVKHKELLGAGAEALGKAIGAAVKKE